MGNWWLRQSGRWRNTRRVRSSKIAKRRSRKGAHESAGKRGPRNRRDGNWTQHLTALKEVLREPRLQGRRRKIERCRRRSAVGLLESREAVIQFMIRNAADGACTETRTARRVAFSTSGAIGCQPDKPGL